MNIKPSIAEMEAWLKKAMPGNAEWSPSEFAKLAYQAGWNAAQQAQSNAPEPELPEADCHVTDDDNFRSPRYTATQMQAFADAKVRGWGGISYLENAAALQDEVGHMMADALNALYAEGDKQ